MDKDKSYETDGYFKKLFADYESVSVITPDNTKAGKDGRGIVKAVIPIDAAAVCNRTGVSKEALFLAAVSYVTARMTNSDKVYITTMQSAPVPFFSELTPGSVDDFVKKTAGDLVEAAAHSEVPFEDICNKWEYSLSILYSYHGDDAPADKRQDDPVSPLTFGISDQKDETVLEIEYDEAMYSEKLIGKIAEYCLTVIGSFAKDGKLPIRSISLLNEEEQKILDGFHTIDEEREIPQDTFFFTGLEKSAEAYPDRTALIATDGIFTYKEFDSITERVANALIKRGAASGKRALILLPRISKALFAIFGASKAGLGYIPFDPTYPKERIELVIEDSQAAFVITTAENVSMFKDVCAVDIDELLKESNDTKPHVELSEDDISYMIYTSGSTGRPKGVMLTHRGMAHYVADMNAREMLRILVDECRVFCSITTLSFDVSVMEYSLPLSHGLTLYFANEAECNDAHLLAKRMKETKVNVISATPSRMLTLLGCDDFADALSSYGKMVINGGEKYPEQLRSRLNGLVPYLVNLYGPSEITISSNEHDVSDDEVISIGRPDPGVTEYIVDTDGNELPVGVVGELIIGGWGVGKGYNNLPELTAKGFITYKGMRMYRSGDYARWLDNGCIEVLGRKDNQIKLRGLRIELGEIESVLAKQKGMKSVAVKIVKINGIEHLAAWFTNEHTVDVQELKNEISRTLTAYMVPTAYMQLEEMPYTPNGKLDMKNLPVPEIFRAKGEKASTKEEQDYCEIFSQLLSIDDVHADENFFDLGGTSLLATSVVIEAGKRGYNIVFGDVFTSPTPKELAVLSGSSPESVMTSHDSEIEDYDYSKIDELLQKNILENLKITDKDDPGNVLVTGATGYLGSHVLYELLEHYDCKVYCLLRSKGERKAQDRLQTVLYYYFNKDYNELYDKRLFVVEGEVTDKGAFDRLGDGKIDTVINCAAIVKHFSHDNIIEEVNYGGTLNVIDFCLKNNARLIHASTISVGENAFTDNVPEGYHPPEQTLYFGQDLTNKYARSKFLAERAVLEAVIQKGLRAKVIRYGNLSARHSDGEFQVNFNTNAEMGKLRAFAVLGCAPYDILDDLMEFSPIDAVAKATVMLGRCGDDSILFHVLTDQRIQMVHVFEQISEMGHKIRFVERDEYDETFAKTENDPDKRALLTSLMAYDSGAGNRKRVILDFDREYTLQVLYRLGFTWPVTSQDYIKRFLKALDGLGFFSMAESE